MLSQIAQSRRLNLALLALLMLTVAVRLPGVARPLTGNFATKNVLYATIARNWARGESSAWYPMLDLLKGSEPALYLIEFPLSAYVTATAWGVFGGSLDMWGRLTSVSFSVAAVWLLYLLMRRWHGRNAALAAGMVLALSPIGIFCGQSFMLQASVVFFCVAAFWCLECAGPSLRTGWLFLAALCLALLLLTKIYMVVLIVPLGWRIRQLRREGSSSDADHHLADRRSLAILGAALVIALLPAGVWYAHVVEASSPDGPFGERLYYTLRDSTLAHRTAHSLLFSADLYRQIAANLATVVLTPVGLGLAIFGLWHPHWRRHAPWLLSAALLVAVLPLKFHKMNYYYVAVLPPLCVLAGLGWEQVLGRLRPNRLTVAMIVLTGITLSARYAVGPSFVTPAEDRSVVAAAGHLRQLTTADEPVVTMHGTSFDLLYYCDRRGWSLSPQAVDLAERLDDYRRRGARLVVVAGLDPIRHLPACRAILDSLPQVAAGNDYRIYQLSTEVLAAARNRRSTNNTSW